MSNMRLAGLLAIAVLSSHLHAEEGVTAAARAAGPKPASLELIAKYDAAKNEATTNVACLAGSVTLQLSTNGNSKFDLVTLFNNIQTKVLALNTASPQGGATLNTGNLSKTDIATLKAGGIASDTTLKVGRNSIALAVKSTTVEGAIQSGKVTIDGARVTKDSWSTKGPNKFAESWSEDVAKGTIAVKQTYFAGSTGISFAASFLKGQSNKASIKDSSNKQTYRGTATYNKETGTITFTTISAAKDGSTASYTYSHQANGGHTLSTIILGGAGAGTFEKVCQPMSAAPASTPDGRLMCQNMPPFTTPTSPTIPNVPDQSVSATENVLLNYQIQADSNAKSFQTTTLPTGLKLTDATKGVISGTPATGTAQTTPYSITITANNAGVSGSGVLSLTINPATPAITNSPLTANGQVGVAFNFQITGSNSPTAFDATSLPTGLSVDKGTGAITGTPAAGTASNTAYLVTISATNAGGTGSATLSLTIKPATPVITSSTTSNGTVGQAYNYTITASNSPTSFDATGLPSGLTVSTTSGAITGTPDVGTDAGSPYSVTISATNAGGTGSATLTLTINPAPPPAPVITNAPPITATATVGNAFTFQITASNNPTSFLATGLPSGLVIDLNTGVISGSPDVGTDTSSPYNVTISATNAGGTGSDTLVLTVNP